MPSATLSTFQGLTLMAPLRLGEQPTNSETTSIEAFCSAGMSCVNVQTCVSQTVHTYRAGPQRTSIQPWSDSWVGCTIFAHESSICKPYSNTERGSNGPGEETNTTIRNGSPQKTPPGAAQQYNQGLNVCGPTWVLSSVHVQQTIQQ